MVKNVRLNKQLNTAAKKEAEPSQRLEDLTTKEDHENIELREDILELQGL